MAATHPELFDVLPSGQLRWALQKALPDGTAFDWKLVGRLPVTAGKLAVMDGASCHPQHLESEAGLLDWPHPEAEIWLQLAVDPQGKALRVMAAAALAPGFSPTAVGELALGEGCRMSIDSASGLVGDWGRMPSGCKLGGPLSRASIGKPASEPADQQSKAQAAALLSAEGFPLAAAQSIGGVLHKFERGLTDEEISRADAILAAAGSPERVRVYTSQTIEEISQIMVRSLYTQLDHAGSPFLFVFKTGFGDGGYEWQSLRAGEQVVGYVCNFGADSEAELSEARSAEIPFGQHSPRPAAVLPADPGSPLGISKPGILVAVHWRRGHWLHAKAIAGNDREGTLLMADGGTRVVSRHCVVAIPTQHVFQIGQRVLARWKDQSMFPGTVHAMSPQGYTIAWQDGDAPLVVPLGALTPLDWCQNVQPVEVVSASPAAGTAPPAVGTAQRGVQVTPPRVARPPIVPGACVVLRRPPPLRIARVEAQLPGGYALQLVDGSRGNVAAADVLPIPGERVFQTGDVVLAHWRNGLMYPGTVTQVSEQGYTVGWHDGDQPLVVPPGCLTYLYWVLEAMGSAP
jgi:hypothetical protein